MFIDIDLTAEQLAKAIVEAEPETQMEAAQILTRRFPATADYVRGVIAATQARLGF